MLPQPNPMPAPAPQASGAATAWMPPNALLLALQAADGAAHHAACARQLHAIEQRLRDRMHTGLAPAAYRTCHSLREALAAAHAILQAEPAGGAPGQLPLPATSRLASPV